MIILTKYTVVDKTNPKEQINKDNDSNKEFSFRALNSLTANGIISTEIYDKRDNFDFDIVNSPSGMRCPSCYILWCTDF